jgi:hypothetical protein
MRRSIPLLAAAVLVLSAGVLLSGDSAVPYPEGYRTWVHAKSMVIQEGHPLYDAFGGIHHVYANDKAADALKKGGSFPDGSVFVFDLLAADASGAAITEGARKIVGVMQKDASRYAGTGGWGFEGFKGDGQERAVTDMVGQCFSCHAAQRKTDYVFTAWRP